MKRVHLSISILGKVNDKYVCVDGNLDFSIASVQTIAFCRLHIVHLSEVFADFKRAFYYVWLYELTMSIEVTWYRSIVRNNAVEYIS